MQGLAFILGLDPSTLGFYFIFIILLIPVVQILRELWNRWTGGEKSDPEMTKLAAWALALGFVVGPLVAVLISKYRARRSDRWRKMKYLKK
jgi:Na+-transporting methylmalonyl-CoA/oxaloacetate decarboxylase gamma subunit